jgi:uncharacterized protein (TIGR03066 family)
LLPDKTDDEAFARDFLSTEGASMRVILAGLVAAFLTAAAGGPAVGRDAKDAKVDGKLLVGKWTSDEEKKKDKMFIEFTKDGKLAITLDIGGGKEFKIDGTYKLDGNKLAVKMSFMGEEKSEVMTVNSLTKTKLVTTDEKGKKDTLVRVEGKGGDK